MLCPKYNCLFVHIPKTAGQSIERVFLSLSDLTWATRSALLLRRNNDPALGPPRLAHLKALEYVTYGYVTPKQFDALFKFSFVRNPWDRIVSEYKFRRYPRRFDFKSFLFEHVPEPGEKHYFHVMPQHEFLFDAEGKCLVNFVGRFEKLKEDFNTICRQLAIPETPLPHANRSLAKNSETKGVGSLLDRLTSSKSEKAHTFTHYTEYYDDESREYVRCMYEKDIDVFGYEFGEPCTMV